MAAACVFMVPIVILKTLRADGRRGSVSGYHAARLQKCRCHASPGALPSDPIIAQAMLRTPIKGPRGSPATSCPKHELLWDLLFEAAFFITLGTGPVVLAGPLVASLVGALEGAVVVGGLTALGV